MNYVYSHGLWILASCHNLRMSFLTKKKGGGGLLQGNPVDKSKDMILF